MKRFLILYLVMVGALFGCGDPAADTASMRDSRTSPFTVTCYSGGQVVAAYPDAQLFSSHSGGIAFRHGDRVYTGNLECLASYQTK